MQPTSVYVSYSWTADNETPVVDVLAECCKAHGLDFRRDRERLKHGDLIRVFMDEIAAGDNIVPVFSRHYFESEYCMYELLEVWKKGNFHQRIHPISLGDMRLDDVNLQLELVNYWKARTDELRAKLKKHDAAITIPLQQRNIVYADIYRHINELMTFASNMNILPLDGLLQTDFQPLIKRIRPQSATVPLLQGNDVVEPSAARTIGNPLMTLDTSRARRIQQLEEQLNVWQEKLHEFQMELPTAEGPDARFSIKQKIKSQIYPQILRINREYSTVLKGGDLLLSEEEAAPIVAELAQILRDHREQFDNCGQLQKELQEIREAIADSSKTATAKLKVTLPVVPLLVNYELDLDTEELLSGIWRKVRGLLGNKANPG